jgi:glycerol uptake facilitator-like aquaporin
MADIRIDMPAAPSSFSLESKVGRLSTHGDPIEPNSCGAEFTQSISLLKKAMAELMSTFILVFAGCGAIMVDAARGGVVTHVGISLTFGLVVAAMVYSVGHISGAHMNPAVTIASALTKHFPWSQVLMYVAAQCTGAVAASFALGLILPPVAFGGATLPSGSDVQSLVLEIIITFVLMFVISAVTTDKQSVRERSIDRLPPRSLHSPFFIETCLFLFQKEC